MDPYELIQPPGRPGPISVVKRLSCAALLTAALGCSDERIVGVDVESLSVFPSEVSAFVGERKELRATALDDRGQVLDPLQVAWSAEDPDVVSVGPDGMLDALAPGATRVTASFRGASGHATVQVLAGPAIAVTRDSVFMSARSGDTDPDPEVVYVANGGGGTLEGLEATVAYDGTAEDWLMANLTASPPPTTLSLQASIGGLDVGTHRATVLIDADAASNAPLEIPVVLVIEEADNGRGEDDPTDPDPDPDDPTDPDPDPDDPTDPDPDPDDPGAPGLTVVEGEGTTIVSEAGDQDTFTVVLDTAPSSDVVIAVSSTNPLEVLVVSSSLLVFTPENWDEPQTVTVRGVDDLLPDGDQAVDVIVAVEDALSDIGYHGLARTVPVTNRDNESED